MLALKLALGIFFFVLGWIYLYKPNLVLVINKIARELLFNDRRVLLEKKKLAILFFCVSFVLLYMGYTSLARFMVKQDTSGWLIDPYTYAMYIATQDYYAGRYENALKRYKNILSIASNKQNVLKCIASTYFAMGEKEKAKNLFDKLLQIDPNDQMIKIKLQQLKTIKK